MNKKLFVLFVVLILFLGLSWASLAKAEEKTTESALLEKLKAGKTIKPGEQVGKRLNYEEADYYKMEVKPGQQIKIYGSGEQGEGGASDIRFTLYNEEGVVLSRNKVDAYTDPASAETVDVFYLPGTTTEVTPQTKSDFAFFEVYCVEEGWLKGYSFSFVLDKEKIDAGSGIDAGDDFDIAQEIKPGDYPKNFLAKNECGEKYCSTDYKDVYKISVKEKEKLTVKITPDSNLQPIIYLFNELREEGGRERAASKKAITEISYVSPKDQNIYIDISDVYDNYYGSYAMSVAVKEATAKELEEAGIVEEVVPEEEIPEVIIPEEEMPLVIPKEEIPEAVAEIPETKTLISQIEENLIWVAIGVLVFIVIIVVVIILVVRARKKPPKPPLAPPKPPISPTLPKVPPTRDTSPAPPEIPRPPAKVSPTEPVVPKPPSEEGTSGMILPPKELRGK